MTDVKTNATLLAQNLISYRGSHSPQAMKEMMDKLEAYVISNGAKKLGQKITAVYSSDPMAGTTDVEVFFAIDSAVPTAEPFIFASELIVDDCLMVKYKGNPRQAMGAFDALAKKSADLGRKAKQPVYNVMNGDIDPSDVSNFEMTFYMPLEEQ